MNHHSLKNLLFSFLSVILSLLIYTTVLILPIPKEIGLAARNDFIPVIVAIALFYPAFRLPSWTGTLASLSLTLILFALPLSGAWNSGASPYWIIGGLLPWSDASNYYHEARLLLEGDTLSLWGSNQRPLAYGILAGILGLTQQNLQITLAIIVLITAIACFMFVREMQYSHGTVAGLVVLAIIFLFYRYHIGTTTTENLGLTLGLLGIAILWRGTGTKHINTILLGILLLTLALNARTGAMFVLPALVLWGILVFRKQSRISLHFLVGGIIVVLLGFLLNFTVLKVAGHPDGTSHAKFSPILYGLAVGKGRTQVWKDHPGSKEGSEIYQLAFEAIWNNPATLIKGTLKISLNYYFNPVDNKQMSAFGFIYGSQSESVVLLTRICLYFLSFWGFLRCYCQRHDFYNSLMFAATLGIVLSVPFLVTGGIRIYAATIPFTAILIMLGIVQGMTFVAKIFGKTKVISPPVLNNTSTSKPLITFGITLVILTFLAPIVTYIISTPPQFVESSCPSRQEVIYMRMTKGSSVTIISDKLNITHLNLDNLTWLPNIRVADFHPDIEIGHELKQEVVKTLKKHLSITIMNSFDFKDKERRYIWLIADSRLIPREPGIMRVCGVPATYAGPKRYGFFHAKSIEKVGF